MSVVELGGKPNPGTSPDRRLKENKRRKVKTKTTYADDMNGDCPPDHHMMSNGKCMPDEEMMSSDVVTDELDGPLKRWEGVLAVEGVETGDGREFAPGSLEWPDPETTVIPLMWQEQSKERHQDSIVVGRIEELERVENEIHGTGVIRADVKVADQMRDGIAGGVSVDVDSVKGADIEVVFGDDEVGEAQGVPTLFGPEPEKVIFHRGRIRGATLVALPAFVEAQLHLVDDEGDALVASGIPVDPPREWFEDPQLDEPTPWTVEDDGRVYGHMALWSSCHQTFPNRCVTPPREGDYPYFMRRELKTAEGELVGVGPITMGTGHASTRLGAVPAAEHYDHTGAAVVDVAVGEDKFGIWIAGALRSTVSPVQLRALRGAALSGDWRRIGGRLRLVAVLAVNVPGFPIPRMRAQVDDHDVAALVAAGVATETRTEALKSFAVEEDDGTIRVRRVLREFTAIPRHDTGTTDAPWDSGTNVGRLPSPMSIGTARDAYAWVAAGAVQDGEVQKTDLKFPHHMVNADGSPGAANLAACSSGIGILNGGRGGTSIPAADRAGVYAHLAAHLRDAGRTPPPLA